MRINYENIILRDMIESDIEDYVRWFTIETEWSNTDAPWEPIESDEETERTSWREYYESVKDLPDDVRRWKFEIEWNGRHVGWVSSYSIDENYEWIDEIKDGQTVHRAIGIDICEPDVWGNGIGTNALRAFIKYYFENDVEELYTQTWSGNVRMLRCAEKLGFKECRRDIGIREVNGKKYDRVTFKFKTALYPTKARDRAYTGDSSAQYDLAKYCEEVDNDIEQAAFWYKKAALQDHDLAIEKCRELGVDLNAPKLGREEIRKELKCRIYPIGYLERYKFTVICANYQGKWILSKHKKRDTWETQGGHIEASEDPIECARRELFEESGIKDADIYPVCDYWGFDPQSCSNGMVFLAVVHSLGELPESEMKEIGIFDTLPAELTYPQVSPRLYEEAEKLLSTL